MYLFYLMPMTAIPPTGLCIRRLELASAWSLLADMMLVAQTAYDQAISGWSRTVQPPGDGGFGNAVKAPLAQVYDQADTR